MILKHVFDTVKELNYYRKNKVCCSCKNFIWFHGSAGFCKYGPPGPSGMIDCMATCNLTHSEYKYNLAADIKSLKNIFTFMLSCKYKGRSDNNCNKSNDDDSETLYF